MLPQPETICQLPYSVEIEEPERAYSTMDLKERKKMNRHTEKPHSQLRHSHMIAKEHQNKKESKIRAKLQQMDQRWGRET